MQKDAVFRFRIPADLLDQLKDRAENLSGYVRRLIELDLAANPEEVRALVRTPYFYHAEFLAAIDGDTVQLNIDAGFEISLKVVARLAGVNAPEAHTAAGKRARKFVAARLKNANLIVETRKREKYSRYLALVYYHKTYTEFDAILKYGTLLNRELIDAGHARRYDL